MPVHLTVSNPSNPITQSVILVSNPNQYYMYKTSLHNKNTSALSQQTLQYFTLLQITPASRLILSLLQLLCPHKHTNTLTLNSTPKLCTLYIHVYTWIHLILCEHLRKKFAKKFTKRDGLILAVQIRCKVHV